MNPTAVIKQPVDKTKSVWTKYSWYAVAIALLYSAIAALGNRYHGDPAEKFVQFIMHFFYNIGVCLKWAGGWLMEIGLWIIDACK